MASKSKKTEKTLKQKETFLNSFSLDKYIPSKFQIPLLLAIILLLFLIFYSPLYFDGKTFQSGDIITSKSSETYVEHHGEGYTLWNPFVFGGMPAYALAVGPKWFNLVYVVNNFIRNVFSSPFAVDYAKWTFYLLALAFTTFIFFNNL